MIATLQREFPNVNFIPHPTMNGFYVAGRKARSLAIRKRAHELDVPPATSAHPPREDTYSITSRFRLVPPYNLEAMQDDFQDAQVVGRDGTTLTVDITTYPLHQPPLGETPDWRAAAARFPEYLQPGPSVNWDESMRQTLLADLKADGIEPDQLTDRQVVEKVSRWAMKRSSYNNLFSTWEVDLSQGTPHVPKLLRAAFDKEKPDESWSDQQMFEHDTLGRQMYEHRTRGACTSSATYLATILRAVGIPTRIVVCIPPFDVNDEAQAQMFYAAVSHNQVRETVRAALDGLNGFADHFFNEVYVGGRWVRLNYAKLNQPVLDSRYFGLLTHVDTCSDISQLDLPATWGLRYAHYRDGLPGMEKLSSTNPYQLLGVSEHFGARSHIDNPSAPIGELRTVTVSRILKQDAPELSRFLSRPHAPAAELYFLLIDEWVAESSYRQLRSFSRRAGTRFRLTAPGHRDLGARLQGPTISAGDGSLQGFGISIDPADRADFAPGVNYQLVPQNTSDLYRWSAKPGLTWPNPGPSLLPNDSTQENARRLAH